MPTKQEQMQEMLLDRQYIVRYATYFIGTWYSWGGDDPDAFDCSGFLSEVAQAGDIIGRKERLTAEGFRERFFNYKIPFLLPGTLVLFFDKDKNRATHIELGIDNKHTIGASGGGSKTLTKEDAIRDNAFVKCRPVNTNDTREIIYLDAIMSKYPELWIEMSSGLVMPEKKIII